MTDTEMMKLRLDRVEKSALRSEKRLTALEVLETSNPGVSRMVEVPVHKTKVSAEEMDADKVEIGGDDLTNDPNDVL